MISYIKGIVKQKYDKSLLIVSGSLGYKVFVIESLLLQAKPDDSLELYTHSHLSAREEMFDIYGFVSLEELDFFELLISVSGVGRKSALATLSVTKIDEMKRNIASGDPALLQKVSGIGKKTSERIVMELKDKVMPDGSSIPVSGSDSEIVAALEGLGYKIYDIREVLRQLPENLESSEAKIKEALKILGK